MSDERHVYGTPAEPASEVYQLERQLFLLIEAAEAFLDTHHSGPGQYGARDAFEDRIETAKAHLS